MPNPIPQPQFERKALEEDIRRLSAEVERLKKAPEHRGKNGPEIVRKSVVNYSAPSAPPSSSPAAPAVPSGRSQSPLPSYAKDITPAMKLEIENLLEKAFTQGIGKASADAAKTSPYLMDLFHDALTTHLYPELKKRGVVD